MAKAQASVSFDQFVQEGRKKRETEQLAQEIFGSARRSRTPLSARVKPAAGASLASRVGVAKRALPPPRSDSAPARVTRPPPRTIKSSDRPTRPFAGQPVTNLDYGDRSNGYVDLDAPTTIASAEINIRGAAGGPYVVIAQNFAPGTTAADIEHVMMDVGGQITECRLIASNPTVIAEMVFVEKTGAEAVIATFNNKKADGRTLHVYLKGTAPTNPPPAQTYTDADIIPAAAPAEETMEVDDLADAREAENRLREERRGRNGGGGGRGGGGVTARPERGQQDREVFPTGPRGGNDRSGYNGDDYYHREPRRAEPVYQDGRYGVGGGDRYGPPPTRGGRFREEGRMYSDGMRRGGNGQRWRP